MSRMHDVAQMLVSCWVLSDEEDRSIPTSHGLLDRALYRTMEATAFPDWMRQELQFTDSRIGLQCVGLPDVLDWAQRSELTSAPNPSYHSLQVQISPRVARRLLRDLGVAAEDAASWGKALREGLERAKDELMEYNLSATEEG
ncbi:hypothetical protein V5E97_05915 [Singulisphaera sp. Ch08]|uniref:Uncharacterized protein n=1 Tax=Singulisphaera sp. Ch08 TaxID=3120278 RepID=A0AAU7CJH6_9BACT